MNRNKLYLLFALFALFGFLFKGNVLAQDTAGITIIPPRFELFANPGDVISERIRVRNGSDQPMTFGVLVEDFSSTGEEGQVVLEEGESDASYSLKKWIELSSQNIVVQPDQETTFPFTISVPKGAEPGGHYASVLFQLGSGEPTGEGVTAVRHRVGALILLRVSGNVVEDAKMQSFSAPTYSKNGPVTFTLRLKNDGTTHIRPNGTIIITNMFGKKVEEIPLNGLNVFPGAIRKMETEWSRDSIMGYYTATLVATYGQQDLPITAATKFLVLSPVMAVILLVAGVALVVFVLSLVSGRSRLIKALKIIVSGK